MFACVGFVLFPTYTKPLNWFVVDFAAFAYRLLGVIVGNYNAALSLHLLLSAMLFYLTHPKDLLDNAERT